MHRIGFSTGALAYGDFQRGIELQRRAGVKAIELSALRERELPTLVEALPHLDLAQFEFRSFHAPSALSNLSGAELAELLNPVATAGFPLIVHPDVLGQDLRPWQDLGSSVLLENMDVRKSICRTAREMAPLFDKLPDAKFCFDIGHAHQVDPTMSVAVELMRRFEDKMEEVHISEVNWECKHRGISTTTAFAFHAVARMLPTNVPIIIESVIDESQIERELATVLQCLDWQTPLFPLHRAERTAV